MRTKNSLFVFDIVIIVISIFIAVFLARNGFFIKILTSSKEAEWLGSLIAGMFFTSFFTTAPAIVVLGGIAQANSVLYTAVFGGIGAVIGDMVILNFFKDKLSPHLLDFVNYRGLSKRVGVMFRSRFFKWLPVFIGGLIIASPLPDELGVALMGISKVKPRMFVLFSFVFNFIGIYLIGLVAQTL